MKNLLSALLLFGFLTAAPITVVIPVRSANVEHLDTLLSTLSDQSVKPDHIIVYVPPNQKSLYSKMSRYFKAKKIKGRVFYSPTDNSVAKVKNFSAKKVTTPYLFFVEPEVTLHPQTIETLVKGFEKEKADLLLLRWTPEDFGIEREFYAENELLYPRSISKEYEKASSISDLKKWPQVKFGSFAIRTDIAKRAKLPTNWELIPNWQINDMHYIFNLIKSGKRCAVFPEPLLQLSRSILDDHY